MRICIYHRADLDGKCSAAIWKMAQTDFDYRLVGADYGDPLPCNGLTWNDLACADVALLDFSLQPWENMQRIAKIARTVTWIDHHKTAIEDYKKHGLPDNVNAVLGTEYSACELAWKHYFHNRPMPHIVYLLGRYDVWDIKRPNVLEMQYGVRSALVGTGIDSIIYLMKSEELVEELVASGRAIIEYLEKDAAEVIRGIGFTLEFAGHRWLAINRSGVNSKFFGEVPKDYDGCLAFCWNGKKWKVTMFSDKIDVSEIAKWYGGGGHKGAAGFTRDTLPFYIPVAHR